MIKYTFNKFKSDVVLGQHNLSASDNTYYIALVNTLPFINIDTNMDTDLGWNVLSASWDITNTSGYNTVGYSPAGLTTCTITTDNTNNLSKWSCDTVTWLSSTIDADGYVIYKGSDYTMVLVEEFDVKKQSSNASLSITFTNGLLNLRGI
jgi:hypothetical protein